MIAAHRAAGTLLGCIFQLRYMPQVQELKRILTQGLLGRITFAGVFLPWWRDAHYYQNSTWRGTLNLDGGGALMNQTIHLIDLLCHLLPPITAVSGMLGTLGHAIEAEDTGVATVQFANGALGVIYGSTAAWPGMSKRLEIYGTKGSAILTDTELLLKLQDTQGTNLPPHKSAQYGADNPAKIETNLHRDCLQDFIACVVKQCAYNIDGQEARRSVAVIEAIYRAAYTQKQVKVDHS